MSSIQVIFVVGGVLEHQADLSLRQGDSTAHVRMSKEGHDGALL